MGTVLGINQIRAILLVRAFAVQQGLRFLSKADKILVKFCKSEIQESWVIPNDSGGP